jgi:hypothetical protein
VALFFDKAWFDGAIAVRGLSRADLAHAASISAEDLVAMFKDQMEVSPKHVAAWAHLLGETEAEIASRCGMSTPTPSPVPDSVRIKTLEARIAALEGIVARMSKQLDVERQVS